MPSVSFHRLAERELNDAALYYERESPGLGTAFLDDVEHYLDAIAQSPEAGTKIYADVRRPYFAPISVRNPLYVEAGPYSSLGDHEFETSAYILDWQVLKSEEGTPTGGMELQYHESPHDKGFHSERGRLESKALAARNPDEGQTGGLPEKHPGDLGFLRAQRAADTHLACVAIPNTTPRHRYPRCREAGQSPLQFPASPMIGILNDRYFKRGCRHSGDPAFLLRSR